MSFFNSAFQDNYFEADAIQPPPSQAAEQQPEDEKDTEEKKIKYYQEANVGFPEGDDAEVIKAKAEWKERSAPKRTEAKKAWTEYFMNNGSFKKPLANNNALKALIRKFPVPNQFRPKVWLEVCGAHKKIIENEGYYQTILNVHAKQLCVGNTQIELDLARTFPTHPYFKESKAGRHEMRRILVAYSWRNPLVAYCQSLNYIVGLLLLFFSEEEAFWMLVVILEEILPANFYSPQLKGLRVDGRVFDDLLKERLPKLYTHFMLNDVDTVTFISGWFMRLYVDVFPLETSLRIWDILFSEGSKVLFRVALAYLKHNETMLLSITHIGEVLHFFNNGTRSLFDHYTLVKNCFSFYSLKRDQIDKLRNKYTPIIDTETVELEKRREAMKAKLQKSTGTKPNLLQ